MQFADRLQEDAEFRHFDVTDGDRAAKRPPSPAVRIVGSSCGAFVLCFVAVMNSGPQIERFGEHAAGLFWIAALVCGALGGFAFPRVGHFLAYAFLVYVNVMVSLTIGRNFGEQVLLFAVFAVVEVVFYLSGHLLMTNQAYPFADERHDEAVGDSR